MEIKQLSCKNQDNKVILIKQKNIKCIVELMTTKTKLLKVEITHNKK